MFSIPYSYETGRGSLWIGAFKPDIRDGQGSRREIGENPVEVSDAPGFVSSRVLMPLLNQAMYAVMECVARSFGFTKPRRNTIIREIQS